MRNKSSGNPRADAAKRASLSIVWGVVAGIAYLGLINGAVDIVKKATGWSGPGTSFDTGLRTFDSTKYGGAHATFASVASIAIPALPVVIVAIVALGIASRVRPGMAVFPGLLIAAAALGLVGAVLLFLDVEANTQNRNDFLVALGTIVGISILLRLQKFVRRFYRRTPAVASLIVGLVVVIYIFLSNGTSIPSIVLAQIDIWLALVAFAIALYGGIAMVRLGQRMGRGR